MKKESLLSQWKAKKKIDNPGIKIEKAPEGAEIPLSHSQQRLWFVQQVYPNSAVYNYSERYCFKGKLNVDFLLKSIQEVCNNQDLLKTTYEVVNDTAILNYHPEMKVGVTQYNFSDNEESEARVRANEVMYTDARKPFDLEKAPMVRVVLIKIKEQEHFLLFTLHHISTDKWSMRVLRDQIAQCYKDLVAGNEISIQKQEIQFLDYAYWQKKQKVDEFQIAYWKDKLKGEIPKLNLPSDKARPLKQTFEGGASYTQEFSKELSARILNLSKKLETTPYVLMLSVYYLFLYKYTGQYDILIGTPIASRDQKVLEDLIGFFNDTIVLRTQLDGDMSFKELVASVKTTTLEAFSNKDVPFDRLVKELKIERSLSLNPFFQAMFLYHAVPESPSFGDTVNVEHEFYGAGVSKFDLTVYISEENNILTSTFEYTSDLFEEKTINRFQEYYKILLEGVTANPEQHLQEITMLTTEERQLFLSQKNDTNNPFPGFQAIHDIISDAGNKSLDAVALKFNTESLTYGELLYKSNGLATEIIKHTSGENKTVALCIEQSLEMIVGMLAILKAGCAYLPIDPEYPEQRIDYVLNDADTELVLTQSHLKTRFTSFSNPVIDIENVEVKTESQVVLPKVKENDIAYIIYTSGSTGKPKGVPVSHKNIINSTSGRLNFYEENPSSFLLMSSISFDSSKAGIFWTLCTGGKLVIAEKRIEQDISKIEALISREKVSHTLMLPTLYNILLDYADAVELHSIKSVIVAGEACSPLLCAKHFETLENTKLYNEYGPTEATVWCIAHKIEKTDLSGPIPIGKPVANSQIYLLDKQLKMVPFGAVGEIYIGGEGLSGKYINSADLTLESYVQNPFSSDIEDKLYKTGDLAKYRLDGAIEFLGRSDEQVKIRGYRIELDEVENSIKENPTINEVVVIVDEQPNSPKRLNAYITTLKEKITNQEIKTFLKVRIPDYMVPAVIVQLSEIPKLPNGKVDKKSLLKIKPVKEAIEEEQPKTALEQNLLDIWKQVLRIDEIGVNDNFFDLGGDSILSIQFIARAKKQGIVLSPNQIFDYQTVKELASYVSEKEKQHEEWSYLVALKKEGTKKPLFCIHAGGGHVFFYNTLKNHIDEDRPIYALQASGVYGNHRMHRSIEEMATDYLTAMQSIQPEGPYNILVYCFSVAVGHEMMIQLNKLNQKANLIVMDTMADPWNLNTPERFRMRVKGFLKRILQNPFVTIKSFISVRLLRVRQLFIKLFATSQEKALVDLNKNLIKVCSVYEWKPIQGSVNLILTEKVEKSINTEVVNSWKALLSDDINVVEVKGNHITLFEEPDIKYIAEKINAYSM